MTRRRISSKTETSRYRSPGTRLTASTLGNDLDRSFYRVLKMIKNHSGTGRSTVFDPVLTAEEATHHVPTLIRVEKGVFEGKYTGRPWRFIKHVNAAFDHILTTKSKRNKIHIQTLEFKEVFDSQMNEIMEELGYCCGTWYNQEARRVSCMGTKSCIVPEGELYFRYSEWTYCLKCFESIPGNAIDVETTVGAKKIHKTLFQTYFFEVSRPERFIRCELCGLKFHEVCVLHCLFSTEPFICDKCKNIASIPSFNLRASTLPETECDKFINDFLKRHRINLNDQLTIRLLTDVENELPVPAKFLKVRSGPDRIKYRSCTLFTFLDTGSNTDICIFSVFFQLFGDCCQDCNRNTAYLSYIDSVNFLPEHRTLIYRLILLGLFEFLKLRGYAKIYLWSCPPSRNQDYIFYMKPPKMKIPTAKRLAKWYKELLDLGIKIGVIGSYQGVQETAKDVSDLPYMDGDLWVTRLNEAIDTVNKERAKDCNKIMKLQTELARESRPDHLTEIKSQIEALKTLKGSDARLWELLTVQIAGFNGQYFVIHLEAKTKVTERSFTRDELSRSCSWLNDRHLFMDFFWGHILEFSSLRRAQYSTFVMLWRISLENKICAACGEQKEGGVTGQALCRSCAPILFETM